MSKAVANISTAVSTTTGAWAWINHNSGALSVSIAFVSLLIAVTFYILNYRQTLKKNADEHEIKMLEKMRLAKSMGLSLDELISDSSKFKNLKNIKDRRRR